MVEVACTNNSHKIQQNYATVSKIGNVRNLHCGVLHCQRIAIAYNYGKRILDSVNMETVDLAKLKLILHLRSAIIKFDITDKGESDAGHKSCVLDCHYFKTSFIESHYTFQHTTL